MTIYLEYLVWSVNVIRKGFGYHRMHRFHTHLSIGLANSTGLCVLKCPQIIWASESDMSQGKVKLVFRRCDDIRLRGTGLSSVLIKFSHCFQTVIVQGESWIEMATVCRCRTISDCISNGPGPETCSLPVVLSPRACRVLLLESRTIHGTLCSKQKLIQDERERAKRELAEEKRKSNDNGGKKHIQTQTNSFLVLGREE